MFRFALGVKCYVSGLLLRCWAIRACVTVLRIWFEAVGGSCVTAPVCGGCESVKAQALLEQSKALRARTCRRGLFFGELMAPALLTLTLSSEGEGTGEEWVALRACCRSLLSIANW